MQQIHQGNGPTTDYQGCENSTQEHGYFPSQDGIGDTGQIGSLASQMGNMGVSGDNAGSSRPQKRKNRHAYHNLDQSSGAAQQFPGVSPGSFQQRDHGHSYGQQITPAMTQFPASSTSQFSPGLQQPTSGYGGPNAPASTSSFGALDHSIPASSDAGVSTQGRVDPDQIPSLPRSRDVAAEYYLNHVYPTMAQHLPPPSAIPFVVHDQGNSSPKHARLTLNTIPSTSEALSVTALPIGLILQPLAPIQPGEQAIPVLDFGESGPPRCRRCRTYINPFMIFRSGGNKFVCNMCTFPNDVAPEYFAPTDPSGVRIDRAQRPELTMGTVEYMVPKEYWAKEPVGLRWLFLIDVSQEAISRGFLEAFCRGILAALYTNDETDRNEGEVNGDNSASRSIPVGVKVGFVTFDKAIHYYNCNVRPRKLKYERVTNTAFRRS